VPRCRCRKPRNATSLCSAGGWQHQGHRQFERRRGTTWTRALGSFATQALGITAYRAPQLQWTLDPVADYQQMAAVHATCLWAVYGPEKLSHESMSLLVSPLVDPSPTMHFDVVDRLKRMPPGWLHVGKFKEVPKGACYKNNCGDTWVWVMPDDMEGLSQLSSFSTTSQRLTPSKMRRRS